MIHVLKAVVGKKPNTQEQMSIVSRETETLAKTQDGMIEIRITKREMINVFGLIRRMNRAKDSITEHEDRSIESFKTEK